eukprot:GHVS01085281.1.p1 GENE.GHVS01085281.1~~GHVS01085281.1.p1  ORF type:complete len:518 (-),score=27.55 GHVS01085281.1:426-1979(-)
MIGSSILRWGGRFPMGRQTICLWQQKRLGRYLGCWSGPKTFLSSASGGVVDEREKMEYDVVVVGAGPSGLACAIRLKQKNPSISVCVVEKGAEVGSHILSGNIFEPRALTELFPEWKKLGAPLQTLVSQENFFFLTERSHYSVPTICMPSDSCNRGNYVISLGALCRWMGSQAEELGVEVYPGFSARSLVLSNDETCVHGIQTADVGISKQGKRRPNFQPGMQLLGKQTVLAEGCHGSLSEEATERFQLRQDRDHCCPQQYGLGLKEVWEIPSERHVAGSVLHTVGWPLGLWNYGGSFVYHDEPNLVYMGLVVGLDYKNPYLNPYDEFQRFKHHPTIRKILEGGRCISYGARCLNEGGLQAIPKITFQGGMIVGCSAGFLNVAKIKGSHTAIKSGMIAADCIADRIATSADIEGKELGELNDRIRNCWVWKEMMRVRNCKPAFKKGGLLGGLMYSGLSLRLFQGKEPWTFRWKETDSEATEEAAKHQPLQYPGRINNLRLLVANSMLPSQCVFFHSW